MIHRDVEYWWPGAVRRRPSILIGLDAYDAAMRHLGTWQGVEQGGMLLGPADWGHVTAYVPDRTGHATAGSFTFDHDLLNRVLAEWLARGFDCKGFAHSHPPGCRDLSAGDLAFVRGGLLLPANQATEVLMPVVCDGRMAGFIVYADRPGRPERADILLL